MSERQAVSLGRAGRHMATDNTPQRPSKKDIVDRLFDAVPVIAILLIIFALGSAFLGYGH